MFLSLKWKATSLTLITLITLCGFLVFLNSHQLNRLAKQQQQHNFKKISDELSGLLIQSYRHNLQLIDLLPTLDIGPRQVPATDTTRMIALLDHNWPNLQLNWGIENIILYSAEGRSIWQTDFSNHSNTQLNPGEQIQPAPQWHLDCKHSCRQIIQSPLISRDGSQYHIRLEVSMADMLIDFSRISNTDIGILVPLQEQPGSMVLAMTRWQQTVKLLTNPEHSSAILLALEEKFDLRAGLNHNNQIRHQQHTYNVSIAPIANANANANSSTLAIIIVDASTTTHLMDQAQRFQIVVAIGGVVISCMLLLNFLWKPISRLHRQAELLPMLSSGDFTTALKKLQQNRSQHWLRDEIDTLNDTEEAVCRQLTDMRDDINKKSSKLHDMAMFDSLTELANRRAFMQLINESLSREDLNNNPFCLLFIDLDNFKRINDSMGHNAGDELLKIVSKRLKSCVRNSDIIARLGGDEFCIILTAIKDKDDCEIVAEHILKQLRVPIKLRTTELIISASIGIVTAPQDGTNSEDLLQNADLAMYKAKAHGRDKYQHFDKAMTDQAVQQLIMEGELRRAIKNHEFVLYYQPQIDMATQKIIGFEALIRWQHPSRGLLYPDTFIQLLEETGLIVPLGKWIINEACRQLRDWLDQGTEPVRLAINISPRQLHDNDLVSQVEHGLRENKIKPEWLELEITESMIMENIELTKQQLRRAQALGVSLAIDDFGTGHSSLSHLKSLPLDILKIDRAFINDLNADKDDGEIVSAIIAMAHKLHLKVIAEGVETEAHNQFLIQNHCDFGQGYLFSRPVTANKALQLLHNCYTVDPL